MSNIQWRQVGAGSGGSGESGYSGYSGADGTGSGTSDHSVLTNRFIVDQHSGTSIAIDPGLFDILDPNVEVQTTLDNIDDILNKLAPQKPYGLSGSSMVLTTYQAYGESTTNLHSVTDVVRPSGTCSGYGSFAGFGNGDTGTLTAYYSISGTALSGVGDLNLATLSTAPPTQTSGWLNITSLQDAYAGQTGKAGFWKQIIANITPTSDLTPSATDLYQYLMTHSITGSSNNGSATRFYVDDPSTSGAIRTSPVPTASGTTYVTRWITGVPSLSTGDKIGLTFTAINSVKTHYHPTRVASISETSSVTASSSIAPAGPYSNGDVIEISGTRGEVTVATNRYKEKCAFTLTGYNSKGTAGTSYTLNTNIRVDTVSSESSSRYFAGSGQYATSFGQAFDSTQNLQTTQELQLLNGKYQYPALWDYRTNLPQSGWNYSGTDMQTGLYDNIRWAMFRSSGTSLSNVRVYFGGYGWTGETEQPISNFNLQVCVSGSISTGWVDGNSPYPNTGPANQQGDPALSISNSSAGLRYVTFGSTNPKPIGYIYVRVGFPYNTQSSRYFQTITISGT